MWPQSKRTHILKPAQMPDRSICNLNFAMTNLQYAYLQKTLPNLYLRNLIPNP
jgi:hypothetical protein